MERLYDTGVGHKYYHCGCDGCVLNTSSSRYQHVRTLAHQRWEAFPQMERFDEDEPEGHKGAYFYCKCGGRVANDCQSRYQHRQTQRHKDYCGN